MLISCWFLMPCQSLFIQQPATVSANTADLLLFKTQVSLLTALNPSSWKKTTVSYMWPILSSPTLILPVYTGRWISAPSIATVGVTPVPRVATPWGLINTTRCASIWLCVIKQIESGGEIKGKKDRKGLGGGAGWHHVGFTLPCFLYWQRRIYCCTSCFPSACNNCTLFRPMKQEADIGTKKHD